MGRIVIYPKPLRGNGTMEWRKAFDLARSGYCAVCQQHREHCRCGEPTEQDLAAIEHEESGRRMQMLGGLLFVLGCSFLAFVIGLAAAPYVRAWLQAID